MGLDLHSKDSRIIHILDRLSRPAAPFYEGKVAEAIYDTITPLLLNPLFRFSRDRFGNLIATYWNAPKPGNPCLVLASHMDHPGYHILAADQRDVTAEIMGGLPRNDTLIGSGILLISGVQELHGRVEEFVNTDKTMVKFRMDAPFSGDCKTAFAVPDVVRFRIEEPLVQGRAMDDLVGCAIQLAVLEQVVEERLPMDFMAVFSRAEEVGFIGAIGIAEQGLIPKQAVVVSLEASKHLDQAEPGKGVVIRTGDRALLFDPNAQNVLDEAADRLRAKGIGIQKRRMDGGTCEATLYLSYGYETTGLAVPLINYHNRGEGRVDAEMVSIHDLNAGVELLTEAARLLCLSDRVSRAALQMRFSQSFQQSLERLNVFDGVDL